SAVTTGTHITPTYDAASETLTLSGLDTLADYQQVLRTVAFSSSSNDPDDSGAHPDRTISYTVANPAVADGALPYQFFGFPSGISFSFGVDQVPTTGGIAGTATDFDVAALATTLQGNANNYAIRYTGLLNIGTGGTYTFSTTSDDGSALYIDGVKVVNNDFFQGATQRSGTVTLGA